MSVEVDRHAPSMAAALEREARERADAVHRSTLRSMQQVERAQLRGDRDDVVLRYRAEEFARAARCLEEHLRGGAVDEAEIGRERSAINEFVADLMEGRRAAQPSLQVLGERHDDARERSRAGLAPAWGDRKKSDGFRHGDCLIWSEMRDFTRTHPHVKDLALITRDTQRGGWVRVESGRMVGPHPQLERELLAVSGARLLVLDPDELIAYTTGLSPAVAWQGQAWAEEADVSGRLRPLALPFEYE